VILDIGNLVKDIDDVSLDVRRQRNLRDLVLGGKEKMMAMRAEHFHL